MSNLNFRKGVFFSFDALIALSILLVAFAIVLGASPGRTFHASEYQQMHTLSGDAMQIFANAPFSSVSEPLRSEIIGAANLTPEDMDKSLLDIVGILWGRNKTELAANMTRDFFETILQNATNYSVTVDEYGSTNVIYNSSSAKNARVLSSSSRIVSGYLANTPPQGHVARAWATRFAKNQTLVVMGDVVSSAVTRNNGNGNNQNRVNVTYVVDIPDDANITDATWFIESSWVGSSFKAYVNGIEVADESPGCNSGGSAYITNLGSKFNRGKNFANAVWKFGASGCSKEGGDDGATHIVLLYNTSHISTIQDDTISYFEDVKSNASIRYKKPLFTINKIKTMDIRINLTPGTQVENVSLNFTWKGDSTLISKKKVNSTTGVVEWNNTEIEAAINARGMNYSSLSGRFFWFVADIDEYHPSEEMGYGRHIQGNDSYVLLSYDNPPTVYNLIDITRVIDKVSASNLTGTPGFYRSARWDFNLSAPVTPLYAKWQFAWLYSDGSNPDQIAQANGITLYNHSGNPAPDLLIKEFTRFGYDTRPDGVLPNSTNRFELNFSSGYAINPFNSTGIYTFFIPSSVGYGQTFNTSQDASDDAVNRLRAMLGTYINPDEINIDVPLTSGKIPWMWGPAIMTLNVWR